MSFDNSLFGYDVGYYEFLPGRWLPGKLPEKGSMTWNQAAITAAVNVEMDDTDVLVASYPKSGQTWTTTIIYLILQADKLLKGEEIPFVEFFSKLPCMEIQRDDGRFGADNFNGLTPPRYPKSHLPFELWKHQLEKHPKLKVIQIMRNPKDAVVSWFHHLRSEGNMGGFNGTWDQFFELYKEQKLPYGDCIQHMAEWYKFNHQREQSLIVKYEDIKKDHRGYVVKIAKFIGHELSEKAIDLIVEKSSIKEAAKSFEVVDKNNTLWNSERSNFIRVGKVGGFGEYLSPDQSEYIDERCKKYLEPLGLHFQYKI